MLISGAARVKTGLGSAIDEARAKPCLQAWIGYALASYILLFSFSLWWLLTEVVVVVKAIEKAILPFMRTSVSSLFAQEALLLELGYRRWVWEAGCSITAGARTADRSFTPDIFQMVQSRLKVVQMRIVSNEAREIKGRQISVLYIPTTRPARV
jgi:hypothetical protein